MAGYSLKESELTPADAFKERLMLKPPPTERDPTGGLSHSSFH